MSPSPMPPGSKEDAQVAPDVLVYEDLAFASNNNGNKEDSAWVTATARAPFSYDGSLLNVELFGDVSWPRVLCFVSGICESAETWTVQNLARICHSQKWRLAVLELEGHGLSSGPRVLLKSGKLKDRYVPQVLKFCEHVLAVTRMQSEATGQQNKSSNDSYTTEYALSGASFGGVLAAYASQEIRNEVPPAMNDNFLGTLLLSPAVGVDPDFVPPSYIVHCLSLLSWIMPSVGFMTPSEDPSHYNCPKDTKRNFEGHWPLGTSKLLLDVTSEIVPSDVQKGTLNLIGDSESPKVVIVTGEKDPVVPIQVVRNFVQTMTKERQGIQSNNKNIELIEIAKGDHGLLAQPVANSGKTKKKTTQDTIEQIKAFLAGCNNHRV